MNFIKVKYKYLEDKRLKDTDRVLYGYIVGFIEKDKVFFATDKHISAQLNKPVSTISKHLRRLEDNGYIERQTSPIADGGKYRVIVPLRHCGDPKPNVPKD